LEYKNQNKELKKDIKELKELIESGASKKEVSEDLEAIAEEHGVDVEFLQKLAKSIRKEVEADVESRIKPFAEKEKMAEFNKRFDEVYDKTLEEMPEYKDIISKDAIKSLSLDPKNANKTFAQILEMTYGNLIKGKKTIESGGAGKNIVITEIDFERAKKEPAYFHEIMKNPELKKKYNAGLTSRINL